MFGELIQNSLKSILQIGELGEIPRNKYDKQIFRERTLSITIFLKLVGGFYQAGVTDNGPGIQPDQLDKVWEPGYSTRGTTGLGLYAMKEFVEKELNGRIFVASIPGEKTTFMAHIPIKTKLPEDEFAHLTVPAASG
ncbi:ATP-binding protein [Candidatus Woesearchaeota archaeon]|nr:ATP-binding protein [Candidatus Woesearchaeota archaeon]